MGLEVNMPTILSLCAFLFLSISNGAGMTAPAFESSLESFSHDIFNQLEHTDKNVIFSPFSIQTCLAMVRLGAGGETAAELDRELGFTGQTPQSLADNYFALLSKYEHSDIVQTANKVYVMQGYELQDQYKEVISKKFLSSVENINFALNIKAAEAMNAWVETKTHNIIKNLITPDALSADTRLFLLSAIYFKGQWKQAFDVYSTMQWDFHTDANNKVKVPLMTKREDMPYGSFPELDAQVVRMSYKDSDLSMWIFLPNSINGLSALEKKLTNVQLESLDQKMGAPQSVQVRLPKFKAEFQLQLKDTLIEMGMARMFGNADLSNMLKSPEPLQVTDVIHKAFIEVDEAGTTAAAVTGVNANSRMAFAIKSVEFVADHPFYYVIANEDFVPLFQGTVEKF